MIDVQNLSFSYGRRTVLKNISFQARSGEFLSVLGPNGAGKSTLFRCILGLLPPQSGRILLDGRPLTELRTQELARMAAYIPQSHAPAFNYTVSAMVLMGTTASLNRFSAPGAEQKRQADEALEHLGLGALADCGFQNLSGGEQQLVLIARALAQQARILLMDEPSASLDFGNRLRVMERIRALADEGYTVVQSTHDPEQAYRYSDRILALKDGAVLAFGTPQEVVQSSLISALYGVETEVCSFRNDRLRTCIPASGAERM